MTLTRALASEHHNEAEEAAEKELKQLVNLKTWVYLRSATDATPSRHSKETPCSMFLKPKYDARGLFTLWKARLVDGGHMTDPQRYDPVEKTSPTVCLEAVMALLTIAITRKLEVESFDVPGAYLNANLKPDRRHKMRIGKKIAKILLRVDPESRKYEQDDGSILVEIRKSLYGLPEAAQLWYEYLSNALKDGGYTQCPWDPCLFRRIKGNGNFSIIGIYVDDCIHVYKGEDVRNELYASLRDANLHDLKKEKLSEQSPISFLGLNITKTGPQEIKVDQRGYLQSILEQYKDDIADFKGPANSPCDDKIFRPVYNDEDSVPIDTSAFASKLMKVRYLVRTRPDIELTCSALCTRSKNPVVGDDKYLNRMLKYLKNSQELGIYINPNDLQIAAYYDAGFAVHVDRKSHSGICVCLSQFGVPVHWRSIKQKLVATSSTEAELIAMYEGLDFVIWFREIMHWMGSKQGITTIYQDNTSTITMAYLGRGSSQSKTKHIDIKYFFIKSYIDNKTFDIQHLSRDNMIADFFASPRVGQNFRKVRDMIMRNL